VATTVLDSLQVPDLEPVQLLRPDGTRVDHPDYPVSLDGGSLARLHEVMVVTRLLDQEFVNLQRQGQLALYPSANGQEAAQVGAAAALEPDDFMFPQYRELGMWICRGVDPAGIGSLWRGTWHGGADLLEHSSSPMSIPIGTHALHAVGYAMGCTLDGSSTVTLACIGDGATSEGDVHEALNFAAVYAAPCVFFVQNNQWAISVPIAEQTRSASIAHKAVAYGMPGVRCDGNDVLATYAVMSEAARRARLGSGPTLIEAVTYRMGAHTTSDDPTRYRSDDELAHWAALDPIARLERYLGTEGHDIAALRDRAETTALLATQGLRDAIVDAPDLDPGELFRHVFVDPPPSLLEQQREFERECAEGD
jgi:2-oxoisovalerate dehydrogenase E1 component alpha subunit